MEKLDQYRAHITRFIQDLGQQLPPPAGVETQYIFDTQRDHYQMMLVGWDHYDWTHGCILHLDIKNGKIWIQHNGTELGIADELVSMGVPKEDIVLGFQAPYKHKYTGYGDN